MTINFLKLRDSLTESQRALLKNISSKVIDVLPIPWGLELLAWRYGTDKTLHGYMEYYATHFAPYRFKKFNFLEIGIGTFGPRNGGASLRTWRHYFPRANIFGLDILDKKEHAEKRITVFQGDQSDGDFLRQMAGSIGPIHIIIDDGSHFNQHVNASFEALFPLLEVGGWYVIEDIQTAYLPSMGGSFTDLAKPGTSVNMAKNLCDSLNSMFIPNRAATYLDQHIESVHFYRNIIFIQKGENSVLPCAWLCESNDGCGYSRASRLAQPVSCSPHSAALHAGYSEQGYNRLLLCSQTPGS